MLNDSAVIRIGVREMCSFDLRHIKVTTVVNMLINIYVPNIMEIIF